VDGSGGDDHGVYLIVIPCSLIKHVSPSLYVYLKRADGDVESYKVVKSIEAVGSGSGATKYKEGPPTIVGAGQL